MKKNILQTKGTHKIFGLILGVMLVLHVLALLPALLTYIANGVYLNSTDLHTLVLSAIDLVLSVIVLWEIWSIGRYVKHIAFLWLLLIWVPAILYWPRHTLDFSGKLDNLPLEGIIISLLVFIWSLQDKKEKRSAIA